jgi:hypothetical protein
MECSLKRWACAGWGQNDNAVILVDDQTVAPLRDFIPFNNLDG